MSSQRARFRKPENVDDEVQDANDNGYVLVDHEYIESMGKMFLVFQEVTE